MNSRFKKITALISAAVALAVSLAGLFLLHQSVAWFSANDTVTAAGMTVQVDGGATVQATLRSYGIVEIAKDAPHYTAQMSAEKYDLPQHDPNGISYSQYKLALLVEIEITATEEVAYDLTVSTEHGNYTLAKENVLSNCAALSHATFNATDTVAIKEDPTHVFTTPFVDGQGQQNFRKEPQLTLYSGTLKAGTQKEYFLLEYNEAFLAFINEAILFDPERLSDPVVNYQNDLLFTIHCK